MTDVKPYTTTPFVPVPRAEYKEDGVISKVKNGFIHALNSVILKEGTSLSGSRSAVYFCSAGLVPKFVSDIFKHSAAVGEDPVGFMKSKQFSKLQKGLDLTIVGPLAAVADTITTIGVMIFALVMAASLKIAALNNERNDEKTKAEENNNNAREAFDAAKFCAHTILTAAARIVPIAGAFISCGIAVGFEAGAKAFAAYKQ